MPGLANASFAGRRLSICVISDQGVHEKKVIAPSGAHTDWLSCTVSAENPARGPGQVSTLLIFGNDERP